MTCSYLSERLLRFFSTSNVRRGFFEEEPPLMGETMVMPTTLCATRVSADEVRLHGLWVADDAIVITEYLAAPAPRCIQIGNIARSTPNDLLFLQVTNGTHVTSVPFSMDGSGFHVVFLSLKKGKNIITVKLTGPSGASYTGSWNLRWSAKRSNFSYSKTIYMANESISRGFVESALGYGFLAQTYKSNRRYYSAPAGSRVIMPSAGVNYGRIFRVRDANHVHLFDYDSEYETKDFVLPTNGFSLEQTNLSYDGYVGAIFIIGGISI